MGMIATTTTITIRRRVFVEGGYKMEPQRPRCGPGWCDGNFYTEGAEGAEQCAVGEVRFCSL
jgi:hypothetical protein